MANTFSLTLDTRAFDREWTKYLDNTSKVPAEALNTTVLFVARNAVNSTKSVGKDEIRKELEAPSRVNSEASVGAMIVQKRGYGKPIKGGKKKSLNEQRQAKVEKLIRIRQNKRNFLRAGWIAAIRRIDPYVKKKSGAPKYQKVRTKGVPKGGAKAAKANKVWKSEAIIWNDVQGGETLSPQVQQILLEGLQIAINQEAKSKAEYNMKKELDKHARAFNRS